MKSLVSATYKIVKIDKDLFKIKKRFLFWWYYLTYTDCDVLGFHFYEDFSFSNKKEAKKFLKHYIK